MRQDLDLKVYYTIVGPAVLLILGVLLFLDFDHKIPYCFFISILSLIALAILVHFEKNDNKKEV